MKKGRESYAAREAIKFLEKELHSGNKYIQPQKTAESLTSGKKKPAKMEIQDWYIFCIISVMVLHLICQIAGFLTVS